jgi:alpha-L-fucosidase
MTNPREDRRRPDRRDFLRTTGAFALGAAGLSRLTRFDPVSPAGERTAAGAAKDRMAWWREARFGMFVHWGLYSVLAGEWGGRTDYAEWIRNNAKIPVDEYEKLLGRFNPTEFDADRLASLAADAGAKYLVITSKHHDGFCLFDTKQTDFNVMHTPYRRDIMRMVADACRRHGVRPCWYHSIMDWHHPDYLPRRDWERETRPPNGAQFERYVRYLHAEVEELLTHYGDIGVMWFDGEWESTWTRELGLALADRCRTLAPDLIINSRVAPKQSSGLNSKLARAEIGDFSTPEQEIPDRGIPGVDWESCVTMNGNWGYNRADHNFKSVPKLVSMLVETASKGGNLLLNVGPTGEGLVPDESVVRLKGIGDWMRLHADAIRGTDASPFENAGFRATRKGKLLYSFIPEWPASREFVLPGVRAVPHRAWMMGDRSRHPLAARQVEAGVAISLPERASDPVCSVLACEFAAPVRAS